MLNKYKFVCVKFLKYYDRFLHILILIYKQTLNLIKNLMLEYTL